MSDKIFTPKGGWERVKLTVFMGEVNGGKSLINPTPSTHGHWKPEIFTHRKSEMFNVPCTKEEDKGCGVCAATEGK